MSRTPASEEPNERDAGNSPQAALDVKLAALTARHRLWFHSHLRDERPETLLENWQTYLDLIAGLELKLATLSVEDREFMERHIQSSGIDRVFRHWDFHLDHMDWFNNL